METENSGNEWQTPAIDGNQIYEGSSSQDSIANDLDSLFDENESESQSDNEENAKNRMEDESYMNQSSQQQEMVYEGIFDDGFNDTGDWRVRENRDDAFFDNIFSQMPIPQNIENQVNLQRISEELKENPTELGCLELYYTREVITNIAHESNRYRDQILEQLRQQSKPIKKYIQRHINEDFDDNIIWLYHAILIGLSLIPVTNISCLWSTNPFFCLALGSIMCRDSFKTIDKFFHISNNQDVQNEDHSLHKINPFIQYINYISQQIWIPKIGLCIDEAVEPYKGRSIFVLYHPQKPHKWGMRLYILTCAHSAFTLFIEICKGKKSLQDQSQNKLELVIQRMVENYRNQGLILAMDNFYTTINLFKILSQQFFRSIGTIRTNRLKLTKQQQELMHFDRLKKADYVSLLQENLHLFIYKDNKLVYILSNFMATEFDDHNQQDLQIKSLMEQQQIDCSGKFKPTIVNLYNKFTHATDRRNQLLESHRIKKKSRKWWKQLYNGLFQTIIVNAWKIFQQLKKNNITQRKFRENLVCQIVERSKRALFNKIINSRIQSKDPYKVAIRHYSFENTIDVINEEEPQIEEEIINQKNKNNKQQKKQKKIDFSIKRVCMICNERTHQFCNACLNNLDQHKGLHFKCMPAHQQQIVQQISSLVYGNKMK